MALTLKCSLKVVHHDQKFCVSLRLKSEISVILCTNPETQNHVSVIVLKFMIQSRILSVSMWWMTFFRGKRLRSIHIIIETTQYNETCTLFRFTVLYVRLYYMQICVLYAIQFIIWCYNLYRPTSIASVDLWIAYFVSYPKKMHSCPIWCLCSWVQFWLP